MVLPRETTLLIEFVEGVMLLPTLSPTLIPNCNNLEGECSMRHVGKGDEEENANTIDQHTKYW